MLRKVTAIFFLTLASMIMLAFAVLPHHHHQEYICFNAEHCSAELPDAAHSHDTETNHGCVKNLFQTQISRNQSLVHSCSEGHCHHFTFLAYIVPNALSFLLPESNKRIQPFPFYQERLHHFCYISRLSGRAPPFIG